MLSLAGSQEIHLPSAGSERLGVLSAHAKQDKLKSATVADLPLCIPSRIIFHTTSSHSLRTVLSLIAFKGLEGPAENSEATETI